jgi:hypothetical protein
VDEIFSPFDNLRRAELYALFVDDWVEREFKRLQLAGALGSASDATLPDMKAAVLRFSCRLAFGMFEHGQVQQVNVALGPAADAAPTGAASTSRKRSPAELFKQRRPAPARQTKRSTAGDTSTSPAAAARASDADAAWARKLFEADGDSATAAPNGSGTALRLDAQHLCSPLRRSGDTFRFLHKSLQEYLAALHIALETTNGWLAAKLREETDPPGQQQQRPWARDGKLIDALALSKRPLTYDVAILRFASELVHASARAYDPDAAIIRAGPDPAAQVAVAASDPEPQPLGCALWELLYAARRALDDSSEEPAEAEPDEAVVRAAGNAASVLNWANVPFSGRNLRGLVLGHAPADRGSGHDDSANHVPFVVDLHGAMLHRADLTGACLRHVRLQQALLDGAVMRNAVLGGVVFGEYAAFRGHAREVHAVVLSPRGDTAYSADESGDGKIVCWDRRTCQVRILLASPLAVTLRPCRGADCAPSCAARAQSLRTFEGRRATALRTTLTAL